MIKGTSEYESIMRLTVFSAETVNGNEYMTVSFPRYKPTDVFKYVLRANKIIELEPHHLRVKQSVIYYNGIQLYRGFDLKTDYEDTANLKVILNRYSNEGYPFFFDSMDKAVEALGIIYKKKMKSLEKTKKAYMASQRTFDELSESIAEYMEEYPEAFL